MIRKVVFLILLSVTRAFITDQMEGLHHSFLKVITRSILSFVDMLLRLTLSILLYPS